MGAADHLPPQQWLRCITCDVRYLTRSLESMKHGRPECRVAPDREDI